MDQNIKVTASLYYALLPAGLPFLLTVGPPSSSCRALPDLSNQWWTRMLWCQERRAIQQSIQRAGVKKWILSQDVAHSFISNKTVQQQTQTVCSRTDSLTYSSHSLSSTERHGTELWRHQHAGGKLDQWGLTAKDKVSAEQQLAHHENATAIRCNRLGAFTLQSLLARPLG